MKGLFKKLSVLLVVALAFSITLLSACKPMISGGKNSSNASSSVNAPSDDSDGDSTTGSANQDDEQSSSDSNEQSSSESAEQSSSDSQDQSSSDSGEQSASDSQGQGGEQEPVDPLKEKYSFSPIISTTLPRIDIATQDGIAIDDSSLINPDEHKGMNGELPVYNYVASTISLSNCVEGEFENVSGQVKVRGNYTSSYPKRPIRIKFDKKRAMCGLNDGQAYKSWVLLAEWKDSSMLRNATAFYLGKTIMGSDDLYTSDFRFVEVYINGAYNGVYLLAEQQQTGAGRVDINEPAKNYEGVDIGYFFEYDGYYRWEPELNQFTINYYQTWNSGNNGYSIASDVYSAAQRDYLKSCLESVYEIAYRAIRNKGLYSLNLATGKAVEDATLTSARQAIEKVINVNSLVDAYIINEICCDPDIGWSSFNLSMDMSADGDKKLTLQAPWDFDSALGIKSVENAQGDYIANTGNAWLKLLKDQDWFKQLLKEKWSQILKYEVFDTWLNLIEEYKTTYAEAYARNYTKWNNMGMNVGGELLRVVTTFKTQADAADYLSAWLKNRLNYMNRVLGDGSDIFGEEPGEQQEPLSVEGMTAYKVEAESDKVTLTGNIAKRQGNGSSAEGYLGNVAGGAGKSMTFTVTAKKSCTAIIAIGLSRRDFQARFSDWFNLTLNGSTIPVNVTIPAGNNPWHDWVEYLLVQVELTQGDNVISFTTAASDATNVDYFVVYSQAELTV